MKDKVKYWIDISDYDLDTAQAMLDSKRYLYVGFMCHQSIEKILKAYFSLIKNETPPYTHNLAKLSELTNINSEFSDEQKSFVFELQPLNISSRYPSYKDTIFKFLTKSKCEEILNKTKTFQKWMKEKLEKK